MVGTYDRRVDIRLLRQALQWKGHRAGRSFNRYGLDLSEGEEEGGEKNGERETELHCGEGESTGG